MNIINKIKYADWHRILWRFDSFKNSKRMRRRSYPIHSYIGPNGAGKTLMMVYDTIPSLEAGRPVLSTVRLLDYKNPRPCDDPTCTSPSHPNHKAAHPLYIPLKNFQQLLDFRDGDVLLDEVTGIMNSRSFDSLPSPVFNMIMQLRRKNIALRWTSPSYARADKGLREVTQAVTICYPSFALPKQSPEGEPPSLWYERYAVVAKTIDAQLLDEADSKQVDVLAYNDPLVNQFFIRKLWKVESHAMHAYDTYDDIMAVGATDVLGTCLHCGGKRTQDKCKCPSHPIEAVDRLRSANVVSEDTDIMTSFLLMDDLL
jgi:hypothetical protein